MSRGIGSLTLIRGHRGEKAIKAGGSDRAPLRKRKKARKKRPLKVGLGRKRGLIKIWVEKR